MIAKTERQTYPDFLLASNNCVVAAYPISPGILRREAPCLAGVPFLFYVGTQSTVDRVNASAQRMATEVIKGGSAPHYFSASDLDALLQGTITRKDVPNDAKSPEQIEIVPGTALPLDKLASGWVPYSFGVGHEHDVKSHTPFRQPNDYQRMVQRILPDVRTERQFMKEQDEKQAREAAQLGNRVKALFGMYHPKIEAYVPRVENYYLWR